MTPRKVIFISVSILILSSLVFSLIGIYSPILTLNETQILYLFSTSAQVLAGVYGLTLTGFIFFRNELSREEFEDDTLAVAVESLKTRYFKMLLFITALSIFTLVISNLVMSVQGAGNTTASSAMMNIGQSSFVINLLVIAYFIFDVIAPKRIETASRIIQQAVDPMPVGYVKGSLEEFLANYNQLEYIIQKYGQAYQADISGGNRSKRISNVRLAEFILRAEKIDYELFNEIRELITLRNSIIHGAEPVVSLHMVNKSKSILKKLERALDLPI